MDIGDNAPRASLSGRYAGLQGVKGYGGEAFPGLAEQLLRGAAGSEGLLMVILPGERPGEGCAGRPRRGSAGRERIWEGMLSGLAERQLRATAWSDDTSVMTLFGQTDQPIGMAAGSVHIWRVAMPLLCWLAGAVCNSLVELHVMMCEARGYCTQYHT